MPYNSQKYSKGRSNNRANAKDSATERNISYLITEFDSDRIFIDSLFEDYFREIDKEFKGIYVRDRDDNDTLLCLIDESVEIGCEFLDHIESIYILALENISLVDNATEANRKSLMTVVNPSTHHSWSYSIEEIEGHSGFWFVKGEFSLYKRWGTHWIISGHSSALFEEGTEMIYPEKLCDMNSIEFSRYFETLSWD